MTREEAARARTARWRKANPDKVRTHRKKWTRRFQKANAKPYTAEALEKVRVRFLKKVDKTSMCWNWNASKHPAGYGYFSFQGQCLTAHRVSYTLFVQEPNEWHVLHSCDNPSCVNPAHLRLGTPADNADDRERRGRGRYGKVRQ